MMRYYNLLFIFLFSTIGLFGEDENESSDLFPISVNNKWGYINVEGQVIVEPTLNYAREFHDGVSIISKNDSLFVFHKDLKAYPINIFDKGCTYRDFYCGFAQVENYKEEKFINKHGKVVASFEEALYFMEGYASVKINGKWGYVDTNFNLVIPNTFDEAIPFSEGKAVVKIKDKYGIIDKNGKVILEPQYGMTLGDNECLDSCIVLPFFHEGLMPLEIGNHYGFINEKGIFKIEPKFDFTEAFHESLAYVSINRKYGYINKEGDWVIKPIYDYAENFSEGLAVVYQNKEGKYIDKKGNVVIEGPFKVAHSFKNGLAKVEMGEILNPGAMGGNIFKFGYIDKKGNLVWKPTR